MFLLGLLDDELLQLLLLLQQTLGLFLGLLSRRVWLALCCVRHLHLTLLHGLFLQRSLLDLQPLDLLQSEQGLLRALGWLKHFPDLGLLCNSLHFLLTIHLLLHLD